MHTRNADFKNAQGQTLAARLDEPVGRPRAYALFAHCFTCSKNLNAVRELSSGLTEAGIAVLRFDFTGLGQSEGEFAETSFSSNVADLVAAAQAMQSRGQPPTLLIGHSLGGAAVLQAAGQLSGVAAVATVGAPAEPSHVKRMLVSKEEEIRTRGEATVQLAGREFTITRAFLEDLDEQGMKAAIAGLGAALLVLHSPADETVGIDNASSIFLSAKHPKSFVSLDGADHLLTARSDAAYVGRAIAAWADRYLPAPEAAPEDEAWPALVEGPERKFLTTMYLEGHTVLGDEPKRVGGTDRAPSPYGYLLGALGECTAMTLRMYADRKKLPLVRADVKLSHGRVHARDCDDVEADKGQVDVIRRELTIIGDELTEAQRQRLLEIADKCPVHKTLTNTIVIRTALVEP